MPLNFFSNHDSDRHLQRLGLQQDTDAGKSQNGPYGIADERAELHRQRWPVAAIKAAPDGFGEDRSGGGVEQQPEAEGHRKETKKRGHDGSGFHN